MPLIFKDNKNYMEGGRILLLIKDLGKKVDCLYRS